MTFPSDGREGGSEWRVADAGREDGGEFVSGARHGDTSVQDGLDARGPATDSESDREEFVRVDGARGVEGRA